MMTMLIALWGKAQGWLIAAGAAVAAVFGVYLAGRQSGKSQVKTNALQSTIDQVRTRDDAVSQNAALDDAAIRDRARRRMHDEPNDR